MYPYHTGGGGGGGGGGAFEQGWFIVVGEEVPKWNNPA